VAVDADAQQDRIHAKVTLSGCSRKGFGEFDMEQLQKARRTPWKEVEKE
jgi:hypothetical protein